MDNQDEIEVNNQEEGHLWCDELCKVLSTNVAYACDFIANNFKGVKVCKP